MVCSNEGQVSFAMNSTVRELSVVAESVRGNSGRNNKAEVLVCMVCVGG